MAGFALPDALLAAGSDGPPEVCCRLHALLFFTEALTSISGMSGPLHSKSFAPVYILSSEAASSQEFLRLYMEPQKTE